MYIPLKPLFSRHKGIGVQFSDEPTSNLDSMNEALILRSIYQQKKDKTVVLVSHKESTLKIADTIYRLDQGRVS